MMPPRQEYYRGLAVSARAYLTAERLLASRSLLLVVGPWAIDK
jgi:hypothetical protein